MNDPHYILSLSHSIGTTIRLWAPKELGYVDTLEEAGQFSGDQIRSDRRYNDPRYNDPLAVPCALVEAIATRAKKGHVVHRGRHPWLVRMAARVASFHEHAQRGGGHV